MMNSTDFWTQRIKQYGNEGLADAIAYNRAALTALIRSRISAALSARLDSQDVLQESYLVMQKRLSEFCNQNRVPALVWMRQLTLQKLVDLQRYHFGKKRTPLREAYSASESFGKGVQDGYLASDWSPTGGVQRRESTDRIRQAMQQLRPGERQILQLRSFDRLSNRQAAESLGISEKAASNRYVRALEKLRKHWNAVAVRPGDAAHCEVSVGCCNAAARGVTALGGPTTVPA